MFIFITYVYIMYVHVCVNVGNLSYLSFSDRPSGAFHNRLSGKRRLTHSLGSKWSGRCSSLCWWNEWNGTLNHLSPPTSTQIPSWNCLGDVASLGEVHQTAKRRLGIFGIVPLHGQRINGLNYLRPPAPTGRQHWEWQRWWARIFVGLLIFTVIVDDLI